MKVSLITWIKLIYYLRKEVKSVRKEFRTKTSTQVMFVTERLGGFRNEFVKICVIPN